MELQRNGFGGLTVQVGKLSSDINQQQHPRVTAAKTLGEQRQKRSQLPSQPGNLF